MSLYSEIEYPSLTACAVQIRWKTPTEFPECPESVTDNALADYASKLEFGTLFSENSHSSSWVVDCRLTENGLTVLTHFGTSEFKDWAVAHVSVRGNIFYHRSESTFHTLRGALKRFCSLTNEELDDSIDEWC